MNPDNSVPKSLDEKITDTLITTYKILVLFGIYFLVVAFIGGDPISDTLFGVDPDTSAYAVGTLVVVLLLFQIIIFVSVLGYFVYRAVSRHGNFGIQKILIYQLFCGLLFFASIFISSNKACTLGLGGPATNIFNGEVRNFSSGCLPAWYDYDPVMVKVR